MTARPMALAMLGTAFSLPALAAGEAEAGMRAAFAKCRATAEGTERLACYDRLAAHLAPPRFQGRLTAQTEPFEITAPTLLRYESDGPIFVLYLKDADGGIDQNLHIGGGGSATHRIDAPGTYSLQVSGSETWRIWLDPTP
ncbi:hypothetical protein [Methylobacterium sp. Leaf456]|uniref:hypothetical protein n=1 Tax=Methylobacterium sp. Leaf456 TaxID=1736382 RepID=UPI000A984B9C|nr:hypothetical protein [Methylobacterium sp. Leaf456]